jgi:hemolysin activation/secretion protein
LEFGFDYKSSDNNLEFGGFPVFGVTTEIFQFSAGYDLTLNDRWGLTRIDLQGFYSPGDWSPQNRDAIFEESRAGASADYLYANLGIERQQRLPEGWSARFKGQGQISNENLLASEQIGVGGYDTVRGFEQRVVRADEGFWATAEIYTPPISLGRMGNWENESDELRFLAFYDGALVSNVNRLPMEPNQVGLQSVGVGLRWRYSDWFRLRLDYGWPVGTENTGDFVDENGRMHIGATANF